MASIPAAFEQVKSPISFQFSGGTWGAGAAFAQFQTDAKLSVETEAKNVTAVASFDSSRAAASTVTVLGGGPPAWAIPEAWATWALVPVVALSFLFLFRSHLRDLPWILRRELLSLGFIVIADPRQPLVLLAADTAVILDACDGSTPFVMKRDELLEYRKFVPSA